MVPWDDSRRSRGVSEVVGVVLLFGLVLASVATLALTGEVATNDLERQNRMEASQVAMEQLDADVGKLAWTNASTETRFDVGSSSRGSATVVTGDTLRIELGGTAACSATIELDGIEYDLADGGSLTYQSGAVWKTTESGTTMVSPPPITYHDGAVDLSVIDVEGSSAGDGDFTVRKLPDRSTTATRTARANLFYDPACYRPDTIELTVHSDDFHEHWHTFFQSTFPETATVTHDPAAATASVTLDHQELARRVDDSVNHVVDFTNGNPDDGAVSGGSIVVDKGVGNQYDASLTHVDTQVGYNQTYVTTSTSTTPLDVMFVIDESCSMRRNGTGTPPGPCDDDHPSDTRIVFAKTATTLFVQNLRDDSLGHQAGIVGYPYLHPYANASYSGPPVWGHLHHDLSPDLASVQSNISDLGALDFTTPMGYGMAMGQNRLVLGGDSSHEQVMILLTDGVPHIPEENSSSYFYDWRMQAQIANSSNITIHTVSVGTNANRTVTKEIANVTGGNEYYVPTAAALPSVFDDIYEDVRTTRTVHRRIVHNPVGVFMSIDNSPFQPWLSGSLPPSGLNYPASGYGVRGTSIRDGDVVDVEKGIIFRCTDNVTTGDSEAVPWNTSKVYKHAGCTVPGSPQTVSDDVNLYVDGDPVPTDDTRWWQENLSVLLPDRYGRDTDGDGDLDRFDLDSNQVVVVVRANDNGKRDYNDVVLLFEAGDAKAEAQARWVFDLQVAKVDVENG